jgi:cytochrome c-type biogenesis protein CcmE
VVVGAVTFLLVRGLGNALVYFRTADEAVADRAQLGNQGFRLEGVVVPGTVHQTRDGVDFNVVSKGVSVAVANHGSPPSLFQANLPVVVEGHFVGTGDTFSSEQIMVKHSAVYVAKHPGRVTAPNGTSR